MLGASGAKTRARTLVTVPVTRASVRTHKHTHELLLVRQSTGYAPPLHFIHSTKGTKLLDLLHARLCDFISFTLLSLQKGTSESGFSPSRRAARHSSCRCRQTCFLKDRRPFPQDAHCGYSKGFPPTLQNGTAGHAARMPQQANALASFGW